MQAGAWHLPYSLSILGWPGASHFFACQNGHISLVLATAIM